MGFRAPWPPICSLGPCGSCFSAYYLAIKCRTPNDARRRATQSPCIEILLARHGLNCRYFVNAALA
eukprot:14134027-Heterocapsa_arctica.AAC.1